MLYDASYVYILDKLFICPVGHTHKKVHHSLICGSRMFEVSYVSITEEESE